MSEKDIFSDRELSEAAEAVCGAMLDTLPPVEQGGRRFSPAFEQNMKRLIADGQRRLQRRRTLIRAARLAACLALAAALTLAAVPEARAWSADFLKGIQEWFTDHVTYRFDGAATAELGRWRPNYAPEGYEENGKTRITYETVDGLWFDFDYMPVEEGHMLDLDNEHSDLTVLELNGRLCLQYGGVA